MCGVRLRRSIEEVLSLSRSWELLKFRSGNIISQCRRGETVPLVIRREVDLPCETLDLGFSFGPSGVNSRFSTCMNGVESCFWPSLSKVS